MEILQRVKNTPQFCKVELCFSGDLLPSSIAEWQPFFNSSDNNSIFYKTYGSKSSLSFSEESSETKAGVYYTQTVTFRFPSIDKYRAERIALMQKVKYIKVVLTSGHNIYVGRNDYYQNSKPKCRVQTNQNLAEVTFTSNSITPVGLGPNATGLGFPYSIPTVLIPVT
ncbi:hypothetical protein SAMN05216480_10520 [Pustulibacterium marinum]|uniref:Uncharacterized protein n=1 Tax=Pustulibacterium marinum TaxID=1224947 RepID=A0A1I7GK45_9FLAO|nr:hypothetical protein [Pustulibacterium marinum]SFU48820.1 hypothetical protein SAMN05216480_10520 [Pustulibacterium marinum]